jgi:putative transposase
MGKTRFSDSQITQVFRRTGTGLAVPELCQEIGTSSAIFYKCRAKYGGMDMSMMAWLKEREHSVKEDTQ